MEYSTAIRMLRSVRKISQKELAKKTKLDPSYISLLESGNRSPSMKNLEKIAAALEVPPHLMVLLSSNQSHLQKISENDALFMGRQILGILIDAQH